MSEVPPGSRWGCEDTQVNQRRDVVKHAGEVGGILEAFDLTGSLREAARLTGCSPAQGRLTPTDGT